MPVISDTEVTTAQALPPFAALRAFEALVRLGGVRKAARYLGVHYSVISRHVARLDALLGVSLLTWSHNRFTLTPEGERYYARIAVAIAEIEAATREIAGPEGGRPLRIRCSPGLSTQWLAGQVLEFERMHPDLHLEIKPSDTPANLLAHEADANIYLYLDDASGEPAGQGLKAQILARPKTMLAASPALAERLPEPLKPSDLLHWPLLHGSRKSEWRLWFSNQGVELAEDPPGELCWNHHMALEAARLGRGVLLANRIFFERDLLRGDLVELRVSGANSDAIGSYVLVAREDRWSTPSLAALRGFIAQRLKLAEG